MFTLTYDSKYAESYIDPQQIFQPEFDLHNSKASRKIGYS